MTNYKRLIILLGNPETDIITIARTNTATATGQIPAPVGTPHIRRSVIPATTPHEMISFVVK
jgi:hypothetical protein